jgi:GAF domain-containing protein
MTSPAENEEERLRVLQDIQAATASVPPSPTLDQICQEARHHFEMPICLVTLVDRLMLRVKVAQGLCISETPRDMAFCTYTILSDNVFVIPDMLADARFRNNPWVSGEPHLRFYAGAPLTYRQNIRLGSLCVMDTRARQFSRGDKAELLEMGDRVVTEIASQVLDHLNPVSPTSARRLM